MDLKEEFKRSWSKNVEVLFVNLFESKSYEYEHFVVLYRDKEHENKFYVTIHKNNGILMKEFDNQHEATVFVDSYILKCDSEIEKRLWGRSL